MIEGSGSEAGPLISGSGSRRPKNIRIRRIRIRIRIHNTGSICPSTHPSAKLTHPNGYLFLPLSLSLSLSFFSLVEGRGFAYISPGGGGLILL
jgi:hypothetical protein